MGSEVCKRCGKPPSTSKVGSVTSFFFQHNFCQCHLPAQNLVASPICSNCGKSRPTDRRAGSFSAFLFKELRCQCQGASSNAKAPGIKVKKGPVKRTTTKYRAVQKTQFTKGIRRNNLAPGNLEPGNSALPSEFSPGKIIGSVFKIKSTIGLGGMGVVYIAEHTALGRHFALKVLRPELVTEKTWLRFQAEAKTLAALHHSTFVQVYDLGIHEKSLPFYSMDLIEGRNLEQKVADDGPLEINRALEIFVTVLEGLAYAHRHGIIHRDLKPANIMLRQSQANKAEVKILDFGISKLVDGQTRELQKLTSAGEVFGSPYYMSPEQCMGKTVDARSDIYSIGCTLFEVLTGYVPFEADNSVEIMTMHEEAEPPSLSEVLPEKNFSSSIENVIKKCLEKLPENRYQSAKELAIDLTRVLEGKDLSLYSIRHEKGDDGTKSDTTNQSTSKLVLISAAVALTAALVILVATAVTTYLTTSNRRESEILKQQHATESSHAATSKELRDVLDEETEKIQKQTDKAEEKYVVTKLNNAWSPQASETIENKTPLSNKDVTPYGTIIKKEDGRYHHFKFPTDIEIGQLKFATKGGITTHSAMGTIDISVEGQPRFIPSPGIDTYPEYWKRFRPSDLFGVILSGDSVDDEKFNNRLVAASNIGGIRSLELGISDLNAKGSAALNKFQNLQEFSGEYTRENNQALINATIWNNLESFSWQANHSTNTTGLLRRLQNSQDLISLSISDAALSQSDFELIARMPNLRFLYLVGTPMTLPDLQTLTKLNKLETLFLPKNSITITAIPTLAKFASLKELTGPVVGMHASLDAALKNGLPRVNCNIYTDVEPQEKGHLKKNSVTLHE